MADNRKAEKLAAARKKLKEFQQKTKDTTNSASRIKNPGGSKKNETQSNGTEGNTVTAVQQFAPSTGPNEVPQTINTVTNEQYKNHTVTQHQPGELNYSLPTNNGMDFNNTVKPILSLGYAATPFNHAAKDFFDNIPDSGNSDWLSTESTNVSTRSFPSDLVSQLPTAPVTSLPYVPDSPMYATFSQPFTYEHSLVPASTPIMDLHYEQTMNNNVQCFDHSTTPVLTDSNHVEAISSILSNSNLFDQTHLNPFPTNSEHLDLLIPNPAANSKVLDSFTNSVPSNLNLFDKVISPVSIDSNYFSEIIQPLSTSSESNPFNDVLNDSLPVVASVDNKHLDQIANPLSFGSETFYPIVGPVSTSSEVTPSISPTMESQLIPTDLFGSTTNIDQLQDVDTTPIKAESLPDNSELVPIKVECQDNALSSPRSTSENIRQLSMQVNGLIGESTQVPPPSKTSELESRNQELAALLEFEKQCTEQLKLQLEEYQVRVTQLSSEMESTRVEAEARVKSELSPVQQQLQLHVQTLGILVAEKTELQSALAQCQHAAKQGGSQAEELQGRLKASRHRVSDLEKELTGLRSSSEQKDSSRQAMTKQLEQLEIQQKLANSRIQEIEDDKQEITHRLSSKTTECSELSNELHELRTQLSLAQLRVDQLSSSDNVDSTSHLETLYQAKVALERHVGDLEVALKHSGAERDEASQQYQQYVSTLDTQLHGLQQQVEVLTADNARLAAREDGLVKHVAILEKRLQEQPISVPDQHPILAQLTAQLQLLETEKQVLNSQLEERLTEAENYGSQLNEREMRVQELEGLLDRMQGDQPDQARLLAAMESDKVAAARATSQNQRLKQQLEELETGFVDLSNCKLDLTDKLQHERHVTRELTLQVDELTREISELRIQNDQNDHSRHDHSGHDHHGHDHSAHDHEITGILHRELERSKERIEALSVQNIDLRSLLSQQGVTDRPGDDKEQQVAVLSATVTQLQEERTELIERLSGDSNEPIVTKQAMDQLQARFTSTMSEIAELSDEKQRLEHLVLQLQGETETIGEYITLYQKQRSLLRQRAQEKDTQLKCLSQDREEMRAKLSQLNQLIQRLVAEKGVEATDAVLDDLKHERLSAEKGADAFTHDGFTNGELTELSKTFNGNEQATTENVDTADKIMALLTEIGSSNLVDPQQLVEHFHPCAWCSGRLITV